MIRVPQVRLIGSDGKQVGVVATQEALATAESEGLDLIEISPTAKPPVCKISDFGKYKYELAKKQKDAKKKQHIVHLKEIKMHPKTEEHDYAYRIKHAREFLAEGDRVRVTVVFKGREMAYLDFGRKILEKAEADLQDIANVEVPQKLEGRNMMSVFYGKSEVIKKHRAEKEREQKLREQETALAAQDAPVAVSQE